MSKSVSWARVTSPRLGLPLSRWVALALYSAGAGLAHAALRLRRPVERAACLPEVEFHALYLEAGAPEGALYLDGEFVGVLPVSRL
jgi:hypothetical protein